MAVRLGGRRSAVRAGALGERPLSRRRGVPPSARRRSLDLQSLAAARRPVHRGAWPPMEVARSCYRCTPVRSLRARRGRFAVGCLVAAVGAACMALSGPWRNELIAPGVLSVHHAHLVDGANASLRCAQCHGAGNASLSSGSVGTSPRQSTLPTARRKANCAWSVTRRRSPPRSRRLLTICPPRSCRLTSARMGRTRLADAGIRRRRSRAQPATASTRAVITI